MEREETQNRILIAAALLLAAVLLGYHAFYVPQVSRPAAVFLEPDASSQSAAALQVNLNTATAEELEALPGVGPVTAAAILEYREQYGPFLSPEELLEVKGIGEKTLEALQDFVYVEETE